MRILDEKKQAVRKAMLTDLGVLDVEEVTSDIDLDRIMIPEGTQLHKVWMGVKDEVASLKADLNTMKEEKCRWQREAHNLRGKLASAEANGKENARLAELFRFHLDDRADDAEHDNEWERDARQITFNEVDAEVQREFAAEGIDE